MSEVTKKLEQKAFEVRKTMLDMCIKAGTGHVTSSMSCIDILVALYYGNLMRHKPDDPHWADRDRLFLSKGQASPALYTVLADCGYFDAANLQLFAQKNGNFGVHLQESVPGVEITCGSLGHGFGIAAGVALSAKMDRKLYLVFSILGDGECYEGSIWETAMFASHNELNNLIAFVDRNSLCVTDFTENLIALEPMDDKWHSFGWDVARIDGHSFEEILSSTEDIRSRRSKRPLMIIADTVKGRGIDFISNKPLWHGIAPKGQDAERARLALQRSYQYE
ncbi:MAG: transketolase [Phycisphaerae bacterium]|nr:transketolase [Phycisphaerae bacterium]